MSAEFKLPVSSYDELMKIIMAYGTGKIGAAVSLDDLVKSSGMSRTVISKNNGFLVQIGLVSEGNKKAPTDLCSDLSNAYRMGIEEQVNRIWRDVCDRDEFLTKMVSVVSVKRKLSRSEYINHIIYSAGGNNSSAHKAGAGAIIEILKDASLICEEDGSIMLGDVKENPITAEVPSGENVNKGANTVNDSPVESVQSRETTFYVQQYTCESGQIAKIIIPNDASEDDLLGFRDMLNIALRRKFKIDIDKQ